VRAQDEEAGVNGRDEREHGRCRGGRFEHRGL
jgi:hypothetical protein